jgi:hypothetical protein
MKFSGEECNKKAFLTSVLWKKSSGIKYYLELDLIFILNSKWYVIDRSGDY